MIVVCEPNCRYISHETFNQALLYGISLAYPDEKIVFFSSNSHKIVLQNNFHKRNINIKNIEFKTIHLYLNNDFFNFIWNRLLIRYVIRFAHIKGARTVYFLSSSLIQEKCIKSLAGEFYNINFAINMHGAWDKLAYPNFKITVHGPKEDDSFFTKIMKHKKNIFHVTYNSLINKILLKINTVLHRTMPDLDLRDVIYYNNHKNVKYVALSDFIIGELCKYIDINRINICSLPLPAIYKKVNIMPNNDKLKIAIFGYGHCTMLYNLNVELNKRSIIKDYEIRIIGMDGRYIEGFPHVTHPIKRVLTRDEMEDLQEDIDMFLILYEKERYCLSCSGTIIEAYNYIKPVIYLENICIDAYNPKDEPIGIACSNLEDMSFKIENIVNNYDDFKKQLYIYRENIISNRKKIDIKNNLDRIRNIIDNEKI